MKEQNFDFCCFEPEKEIMPPPLLVITEKLYDFSDDEYDEDMFHDSAMWESEENTNSSLVSLYRSPLELMFRGSFQAAKVEASAQNKWLIVNLQSFKEFTSHLLNRDLWSNVTVLSSIKSNFLFWQAHDNTEEGKKVCTFYQLDSFPAILVIDPITGQKMWCSTGMVDPDYLLMDLFPRFMENGSKYYLNKPLCPKRRFEDTEKSCEAIEEDEEKRRPCESMKKKRKEMEDPSLPEDDSGSVVRLLLGFLMAEDIYGVFIVRIRYSCCGLSAILRLKKQR